MLVARVLHGENPGVQLLLENPYSLAGSLKHLRVINRRVGERLNLLPEIVEPANLPGGKQPRPRRGSGHRLRESILLTRGKDTLREPRNPAAKIGGAKIRRG